ncbi:MAG: alpha/beta hydrolase, partial [Thermoleophilaceae bacterium]
AWPAGRPGAVVVFVGDAHGPLVCRVLGERLQAVTLEAACATARDAARVLEWVADHAGELGGAPQQLLIASVHTGGWLAACLAARAGTDRWPPIALQLLIHPHFLPLGTVSAPHGVAAAAIISRDAAGRAYAERLRRAGVRVALLDRSDPFGSPTPCAARDEQLRELAAAAQQLTVAIVHRRARSPLPASGDEAGDRQRDARSERVRGDEAMDSVEVEHDVLLRGRRGPRQPTQA